jgi:branched-chain amino acid transport system ATP-binding protein
MITASEVPALRLTGVNRRFGGLLAVRDVNIDVACGERRVILGPNGAGKTTLFNVVAGDLAASSGRIEIDGRDVSSMSSHMRTRLGVARTYQRSTLFGRLSVADNLRLALLGAHGPRLGLRRGTAIALGSRIDDLAHLVGLGNRPGDETHQGTATRTSRLSHGQQRQLELGIALATQPRLLLLDEPAAGLSPAERRLLSHLLDDLSRDLTIVMIEHDMDVALPFADRVTVMHDGVVVAEGAPAEIAASQVVHDIYLGNRHG